MSESRFYICEKCGNVVGMIHDTGVPIKCCGTDMKHLAPESCDANHEKHIPVVNYDGERVRVSVGNILHPMTKEHNIPWIYLQTDRGGQRKCLDPEVRPVATFSLIDEKPLSVYAYCSNHGIWKTDVV